MKEWVNGGVGPEVVSSLAHSTTLGENGFDQPRMLIMKIFYLWWINDTKEHDRRGQFSDGSVMSSLV